MPAAYIASLYLSREHLGSGILLAPRLVLTCEHVVKNIAASATLTLRFHGQKDVKGSVRPKSKDADFDLALIDLKADAIAAPPAWSDHVREHDQCDVLAWPKGEYEAVPASVQGTKRREINLNNTLDPGSSGGAVVRLIDGAGHCVGVARDRDSPISHAIRKDEVERYLAKHGIKLTTTPPPPPPPRNYDTRKYFEDLRRETGEIDLDSLGVPREGTRRPTMDSLYIPLRTSSPEKTRVGTRGLAGDSSAALETALKDRRLLLVGEAGSGKTTFLRRIAWELCPKPKQKTPRKKLRLPRRGFAMFIRVSSLDRYIHETKPNPYNDPDDPRWLAHYLASRPGAAPGGLDEAFFEEKLNRADSILLLDGLDEAANEQRRAHIAKLVAKASAEGCRYVVSTRPPADPRRAVLPGFAKCDVLPLDEAGILQFLRTWCEWLPRDEEYSRGLLHDVSLTPHDLRSNPFMLTALAVVYLQEKRLPRQRADLYEAIVDWLSIQAEERWGAPGYARHFILNCLQRLALAMQQWDGGRVTIVSVNDAAPVIGDQFDGGIAEARTFLERAREASGILTLRDGQLAFWHKLFLEYLAAREFTFLNEARTPLALRMVYRAEGREVLPLAGVRMKAEFRYLPTLFRALIEDAMDRPLADQAHAAGVMGSTLRDLKSTGWKLPAADEEQYQELLKRVMAIFDRELSKGIPLQSRLEAAEALGAAGDLRLLTPDEPGYWVPVAGRQKMAPFHIGRFPVTVHEYGLYLTAQTTASRPEDWEEQEKYPSRPVTRVSWHDAMAYCAWASRPGWNVTLPTDGQWEFAACGNEGREYPWGKDEPTPDRANYRDTGIRREPTPVGLFPAGDTPDPRISDMAGNVWEWTRSVYDKDEDVKSVRGGCFNLIARYLRAADRNLIRAGSRLSSIGFRCLRE